MLTWCRLFLLAAEVANRGSVGSGSRKRQKRGLAPTRHIRVKKLEDLLALQNGLLCRKSSRSRPTAAGHSVSGSLLIVPSQPLRLQRPISDSAIQDRSRSDRSPRSVKLHIINVRLFPEGSLSWTTAEFEATGKSTTILPRSGAAIRLSTHHIWEGRKHEIANWAARGNALAGGCRY